MQTNKDLEPPSERSSNKSVRESTQSKSVCSHGHPLLIGDGSLLLADPSLLYSHETESKEKPIQEIHPIKPSTKKSAADYFLYGKFYNLCESERRKKNVTIEKSGDGKLKPISSLDGHKPVKRKVKLTNAHSRDKAETKRSGMSSTSGGFKKSVESHEISSSVKEKDASKGEASEWKKKMQVTTNLKKRNEYTRVTTKSTGEKYASDSEIVELRKVRGKKDDLILPTGKSKPVQKATRWFEKNSTQTRNSVSENLSGKGTKPKCNFGTSFQKSTKARFTSYPFKKKPVGGRNARDSILYRRSSGSPIPSDPESSTTSVPSSPVIPSNDKQTSPSTTHQKKSNTSSSQRETVKDLPSKSMNSKISPASKPTMSTVKNDKHTVLPLQTAVPNLTKYAKQTMTDKETDPFPWKSTIVPKMELDSSKLLPVISSARLSPVSDEKPLTNGIDISKSVSKLSSSRKTQKQVEEHQKLPTYHATPMTSDSEELDFTEGSAATRERNVRTAQPHYSSKFLQDESKVAGKSQRNDGMAIGTERKLVATGSKKVGGFSASHSLPKSEPGNVTDGKLSIAKWLNLKNDQTLGTTENPQELSASYQHRNAFANNFASKKLCLASSDSKKLDKQHDDKAANGQCKSFIQEMWGKLDIKNKIAVLLALPNAILGDKSNECDKSASGFFTVGSSIVKPPVFRMKGTNTDMDAQSDSDSAYPTNEGNDYSNLKRIQETKSLKVGLNPDESSNQMEDDCKQLIESDNDSKKLDERILLSSLSATKKYEPRAFRKSFNAQLTTITANQANCPFILNRRNGQKDLDLLNGGVKSASTSGNKSEEESYSRMETETIGKTVHISLQSKDSSISRPSMVRNDVKSPFESSKPVLRWRRDQAKVVNFEGGGDRTDSEISSDELKFGAKKSIKVDSLTMTRLNNAPEEETAKKHEPLTSRTFSTRNDSGASVQSWLDRPNSDQSDFRSPITREHLYISPRDYVQKPSENQHTNPQSNTQSTQSDLDHTVIGPISIPTLKSRMLQSDTKPRETFAVPKSQTFSRSTAKPQIKHFSDKEAHKIPEAANNNDDLKLESHDHKHTIQSRCAPFRKARMTSQIPNTHPKEKDASARECAYRTLLPKIPEPNSNEDQQPHEKLTIKEFTFPTCHDKPYPFITHQNFINSMPSSINQSEFSNISESDSASFSDQIQHDNSCDSTDCEEGSYQQSTRSCRFHALPRRPIPRARHFRSRPVPKCRYRNFSGSASEQEQSRKGSRRKKPTISLPRELTYWAENRRHYDMPRCPYHCCDQMDWKKSMCPYAASCHCSCSLSMVRSDCLCSHGHFYPRVGNLVCKLDEDLPVNRFPRSLIESEDFNFVESMTCPFQASYLMHDELPLPRKVTACLSLQRQKYEESRFSDLQQGRSHLHEYSWRNSDKRQDASECNEEKAAHGRTRNDECDPDCFKKRHYSF